MSLILINYCDDMWQSVSSLGTAMLFKNCWGDDHVAGVACFEAPVYVWNESSIVYIVLIINTVAKVSVLNSDQIRLVVTCILLSFILIKWCESVFSAMIRQCEQMQVTPSLLYHDLVLYIWRSSVYTLMAVCAFLLCLY